MNSPGVQMAYANRLFLKMVHETGKLGRVAMKPTQAMEDGINAGCMPGCSKAPNSKSVANTR